MGIEKERRFILSPECVWRVEKNYSCIDFGVIIQGYLNTDKDRTVRVRLVSTYPSDAWHAFITIKGAKNKTGSGMEFEYEIPEKDAIVLTHMCIGSLVEKSRKKFLVNKFEVELDVFIGDNIGLIIAEVESPKAEDFTPPEGWVEITKYAYKWSNAALSGIPYKKNKDYYVGLLKTINKPGIRGNVHGRKSKAAVQKAS